MGGFLLTTEEKLGLNWMWDSQRGCSSWSWGVGQYCSLKPCLSHGTCSWGQTGCRRGSRGARGQGCLHVHPCRRPLTDAGAAGPAGVLCPRASESLLQRGPDPTDKAHPHRGKKGRTESRVASGHQKSLPRHAPRRDQALPVSSGPHTADMARIEHLEWEMRGGSEPARPT